MTDPWYWPVLKVYRTHLEECHADQGWDIIEEEVTYAEEALHYDQRKDGDCQLWRCCFVNCEWKMEWTAVYKLESFLVRNNE